MLRAILRTADKANCKNKRMSLDHLDSPTTSSWDYSSRLNLPGQTQSSRKSHHLSAADTMSIISTVHQGIAAATCHLKVMHENFLMLTGTPNDGMIWIPPPYP